VAGSKDSKDPFRPWSRTAVVMTLAFVAALDLLDAFVTRVAAPRVTLEGGTP
jgi:hypothetical protein